MTHLNTEHRCSEPGACRYAAHRLSACLSDFTFSVYFCLEFDGDTMTQMVTISLPEDRHRETLDTDVDSEIDPEVDRLGLPLSSLL